MKKVLSMFIAVCLTLCAFFSLTIPASAREQVLKAT